MKRWKGQSGFTVLELVITMLLFSIVLGIGVPGFLKLRPMYQLNGGTRYVVGRIMQARMDAIKYRCTSRVVLYDQKMWYWVDKDKDNAWDAGEYKVLNPFFENVRTSSVYYRVQFTPLGYPDASSSTWFPLYNSSGKKNVYITLAGRVRVL
ncbi:MAG: prepilin-type N-terminal cleavage/methylation domain-containing protein [Deltaproteobacteria bacterium]|nr:prepilin-type N-terminal cleavage/methylation domain-containing protein [Deltaproteobacteria bacterium]